MRSQATLKSLLIFFSFFVFSGCARGSDESSSNGGGATARPAEIPKAQPTSNECGFVPLASEQLQYCYRDLTKRATNSDPEVTIVYYFHGLYGSVDDLFSGPDQRLFEALKAIFGLRLPIIASLSLGSTGVFGPNTEEIVARGLPAVENLIAPGKRIRRVAIGGSMGGHNSLRIAAEKPGTFKAVAALCPALATFNGHRQNEVDAYIERNKAVLDRDFFEKALVYYKQTLSTDEIWTANNPFTLLDQGRYDGLPIYLSVGRQDQVGFLEGSREFKRRADLRPGMTIDYHEVTGPHCAVDIPSFIRFVYDQS
jgi:pimeloyl-ACP methyl ester carboxylesterase